MLHFLDHEGGCLKEGKEEINEFPLIKTNWNRFLRGRFGNKCLLYLICGGWSALVFRLDQNLAKNILLLGSNTSCISGTAGAGEGGRGILVFRFSKRNVPNGGHSLIRTKKFSLQFFVENVHKMLRVSTVRRIYWMHGHKLLCFNIRKSVCFILASDFSWTNF